MTFTAPDSPSFAVSFAAPDETREPAHLLTGEAGEVLAEILNVIRHAAKQAPRSQQKHIGPSQLGHPCDRNLAYYAYLQEPVNEHNDPLAAIIGTAVHSWLADAFTQASLNSENSPYAVEQLVEVTDRISGTADLYMVMRDLVIDWKVLGQTSIRDKRKDPGKQYRTQVHLYGKGLQNKGFSPKRVAIVMISRSGRLADTHIWIEEYRPDIAEAALTRWFSIVEIVATFDLDTHPERWSLIGITPIDCKWCPFYLPGSTDLSRGCPGDSARSE